MSEPVAIWSATSGSEDATPQPAGLVARYRQDHRHPVNHVLHVGVGWPMAALAVLLVPFRPLWTLALFLSAYGIMFFGHFAFERNIPTVLKNPGTPFVVAAAVIRRLGGGLVRLVMPRKLARQALRPEQGDAPDRSAAE
jgi:hypothetical protein